MSDAVNSTISSAGSARNPTNISRRAPSEPNAVPMSIAASAMNTRASANRPTSAIASAARANGRSVASDGTIAAAQHIAPNTMYGVIRKIADAFSATTASLTNSLRIVKYGSSSDGALWFASHARHWLTQPTSSGASASAIASCSSCDAMPATLMRRCSKRRARHRTKNSSASSVQKLYVR